MSDHLTQELSELQQAVIADGKIDADEVQQLRERLYADRVIDRDEAEFLFQINDAVSGQDNDPGWQELFVDAICHFVLNDEQSPGVVDEDEASWLVDRITGDGKLDDVEKALLNALQTKATSLGDKLQAFLATLSP